MSVHCVLILGVLMLSSPGVPLVLWYESATTDTCAPRGAESPVAEPGAGVRPSRMAWSQLHREAKAPSPIRIVVLGDSITKGVRSGVTLPETYGELLQAELKKIGIDSEVVNQGIGGERTDQALARLSRDIVSLEPDIVTVMYGTNDSYVDKGKRETRLTAVQYEKNLRRLVDELHQAGIRPVLMTAPCWGDNAAPNGLGENPNLRLIPFVEGCRKVAKDMKVPLVDHFQYWSETGQKGIDVSDWTTDECHPNPQGHRELAALLTPVIVDLINGR